MGDDQGSGVSAQLQWPGRRGDAGSGPGDGRDDRGRADHWWISADRQPAPVRRCHAGGNRPQLRRILRCIPLGSDRARCGAVHHYGDHQPACSSCRPPSGDPVQGGSGMTAQAPGADAAVIRSELTGSSVSLRRRFTNRLAATLMVAAFVLALVPLGLVCVYVVSRGIGIIGADWFTADIPRQQRVFGPGMGPAIVGTLIITGMATLIAIPLGVLGAIYLNEYGKQRPLARMIRTMADVMTGVPSIVMGLFIYVAWVTRTHEQSGLAAAFALACLMLPIVIRSSEEILRLVPDELRQGSLALGARRWRTTTTVVLPAAMSGIVSGAMLAVARAAGETAPIVVTAGVIFTTNWSLSGPNTALPAQIFRNANSVFPAAQQRAWGAALTLVTIVLVCTLIARLISRRFTIKER